MKKILFLVTQSQLGGAQKYVLDLANGLDKTRFDVAVAAGGGGPLLSLAENLGLKTFYLPKLKRPICPVCDVITYFKIRKLLKDWRPDVLHLNSSKAAVLGSLAARNLPVKVIYTVHGAVFEASFSSLSKLLFLWAEKLTARFKHKIICVSERDRQLWLEHKVASPEKLVTIHNGIDLDIDFAPKDEARKKILAGRSLPDHKIVGFVGYFYPEKNLPLLIEAANLILKNPIEEQKIIFALVGNGELEEKLKAQAAGLRLQDKIIFTGAIPKAARYLKAFDIFVLPSKKEGLPYTILEVMAAGLPIVASRVGGIPEMVADNNNGFLISPTDAEALAERILQILENPVLARNFSQSSLQKVQNFSLEKMISETEKEY